MSDKRTITLTGRPPVRISDDNWPMLASASDKDYDGEHEFQANETSKWFVGVRQHEDGRAIVYATYSYSSNWQKRRDIAVKAGSLLDAGSSTDDIISAIGEVCETIQGMEHRGDESSRWDTLKAECIADLPAEELD